MFGPASVSAFEVSLVITVFNHWRVTRRCLDSIYRSAENSNVRAEVILSDNCSTDETPDAWKAFLGRKWPIRYFRNEKNLGYLLNANRGASHATGEYLCMMNNDVVVRENWLELLLRTVRSSDRIGLVGPKFLTPNGRMLESGAIVRADGTTRMIGIECEADDPRFGFVNEVDYCSMACAVTPRALFEAFKGYDERYIPSYYEDVDYCFRLDEADYRIVVNPEACVVHVQGATLVRQDPRGWRSVIDRHRELFVQRWAPRLAARQPDPSLPEARYRSWRRKPAYVFHRSAPLDMGGAREPAGLDSLVSHVWRAGHHAVVVAPAGGKDYWAALALQREGVEVHLPRSLRESQWVARELAAAHAIEAVVLPERMERELAPIYSRWSPGALRITDSQLTGVVSPADAAAALDGALARARQLRTSQPAAEERVSAALSPLAARFERRWGDHRQFDCGSPPYGRRRSAAERVERRLRRIGFRPVRVLLKLLLWTVTLQFVARAQSRIAASDLLGRGGRVEAWFGRIRAKPVRFLAQRTFWAVTFQLSDRLRSQED